MQNKSIGNDRQADVSPSISHNSSLKDCEGALNEYCELLERFEDRLTLRNLRLPERYRNGDLKLLIEGRWDGAIDFRIVLQGAYGDEVGRDAEASAERFGFRRKLSYVKTPRTDADEGDGDFCQNTDIGSCYWDDSFVFVESVKLIQHPQRGIPSFVWLEPAYQRFGFGRNSIYFSNRFGFKVVDGSADGKPCSTRYLLLVGKDKFTNKLVEGGTQIVNGIPNYCTDAVWNGFVDSDAVNVLSGLLVLIQDSFIWVGCMKDLERRLQFRDVLFGPFDL